MNFSSKSNNFHTLSLQNKTIIKILNHVIEHKKLFKALFINKNVLKKLKK